MTAAHTITGIRTLLAEEQGSASARYRRLTLGDGSATRFVLFELAGMALLPIPGALGLVLRRRLFSRFFGAAGRSTIIGRNCVFRHPGKIFLGDGVVIDDNCVLDARGTGQDGLRIGDGAIINRGAIIQSKAGGINIGRRVSIGAGCHLVSWSGISVGDDCAIAGGCHLSAGTYPLTELGKPPSERTPESTGPIQIGTAAWLATGAIVLDGVNIGDNAVVSAGSIVTHDVPRMAVVQGNPAKSIFSVR
jgi:acetyltransferase-like isoleucine patch superfamily enzyme